VGVCIPAPGGLEYRHELALLHVNLNLWSGDPSAAFAEAFALLKEVCATNLSRFAGRLFDLALRACADLAEPARALADRSALEAALRDGESLAGVLAAARVDPFGEVPATGAADGLTWQAEWTRLGGTADSTSWQRAVVAWDALTRPHWAAYARWRQAEALLAH
jgi:hypothetical protein